MNFIKDIEDFKSKTETDTVFVAIFRAEWCPDCTYINPFIDDVIAEISGSVTAANIDFDNYPELKAEYNVSGIPSFLTFKNGKEISRFVSRKRKSRAEITTFIQDSLNFSHTKILSSQKNSSSQII